MTLNEIEKLVKKESDRLRKIVPKHIEDNFASGEWEDCDRLDLADDVLFSIQALKTDLKQLNLKGLIFDEEHSSVTACEKDDDGGCLEDVKA